jgi:phage terminase small subunit
MSSKTQKRHEIFAAEYVIDLNGARAAQAAGIAESGASVWASRALTNAKVRKLIDAHQSRRATKLQITADRVVEEIRRMAFSNMADYTRVDADGKAILDLSAITRDQFAAVQEIREDTAGGSGDGERKLVVRTTLKLADKTKNLELLARHLGMLQDNVKVTGLEGLAETLNEIRAKKNAAASA